MVQIFKTPTIRGLSEYIKRAAKARFISIKIAEKKEYYPLSSAQKRIYAVHKIDKNNVSYNISSVVTLEGELGIEKLNGVLKKLIQRHENLRTSFELIKRKPVQKIHKEVEFSMEYIDSKTANPEEIDETVKSFMRPFDLSKPPQLRVGLIRIEKAKHIFIVDMHHIISDFISNELLVGDFMALYRGKELPPLRFQYKDYSQWQNRWVHSEEIKKQEKYWLNVFKGEIPVLNLPSDYVKPSVKSFEGDTVYFLIDPQLCTKLRELVKNTAATLYMILLAVYNILLSKYTMAEDIVVGSPISGRNHADLENIVGIFVNMMAIRNRPEGNKTFREFIEEVKENTLKAFENENYQFDELVNKLRLQRNTGENPLFEAVFNLLSIVDEKNALKNSDDNNYLKVTPYKFAYRRTPFNLLLNAGERDDSIHMQLTYSTALFKEVTIEKMADHYVDIMRQVVTDNGIKLSGIKISHDLLNTKPITLREEQSVFNF